ncbi:glutamate-5-semialdehyde dehydrogenase [Parabacteroides sp. PF5-9]|uniref:glutamate-5-semialdehyde dehydrogenase n=1 Tax=Parabacteroides sp. PF5-9 TaxID=1742404 RepID=UPI0024730794|nr:glutamate-5-semialdehyde dehydrogenase [Parabacteroides sp. PF5-9]MDH6356792.1 glutamate-5-semialdehyde dehydrogenase [Parabacteroides sp. PF5-9]
MTSYKRNNLIEKLSRPLSSFFEDDERDDEVCPEATATVSELIDRAVVASRSLLSLNDATINSILCDAAKALLLHSEAVLRENVRDLNRMDPSDPKYDRLKLTEERLKGIAGDMENVASLTSPLGKILDERIRPNGMVIKKVSVPFGLIGVIYEARPNVTFDVFSLCLKSGNACVLKGGSDAHFSNTILVAVIREVLKKYQVNPDSCILLPPEREATTELLNAVGRVDLIIPRGSSSLIHYVREHARIPVIETGAGICHTYFDNAGDREKGQVIITNAKTRRVSVCNALDCLLIHKDRLGDLPYLCERLVEHNVIIYADPTAYSVLEGKYPKELLQQATMESFGTEFLDYKMSVRVVSSIEEALEHIAKHSSKHSECIVSESEESIDLFEQLVDAACVYANVSTAFTDGAQFGFGAEIGISTQKLHARGPMALPELTTYKYIIEGEGQVRL